MEFKDYQKYRWFYTSSNSLVVGGKSAEQNEELLKRLKAQKENFLLMHTVEPGSPFSVILVNKPKQSDIKESAIFTASFSRAWKQKKNKSNVDLFYLSDIFKLKSMKLGTWGVRKKIKTFSVPLSLVLTKQKGKLRAVPEKSVKKFLIKIVPGDIEKSLLLTKLKAFLPKVSQEEILSALPSGGIKLVK